MDVSECSVLYWNQPVISFSSLGSEIVMCDSKGPPYCLYFSVIRQGVQ